MEVTVPVAAPSAPAQPAAPVAAETISATRAAANTGSFADFDKAENAKLLGKPLADVPAPKAPTSPDAKTEQPASAAPVDERTVSKRQQTINDYERRIAEQDQRIRALEGRPADAKPSQASKSDVTVPEFRRIAALPGAPKLDDIGSDGKPVYETVAEHAAAMTLFVNSTLARETSARTADTEMADAQRARGESFVSRLTAAKTADPDFVSKLTPEVLDLRPVHAFPPNSKDVGPLNILWENVYDSPVVDKLLLHFSADPTELRRFETMPPEIQALPARLRTSAHIRWIVKEFGKLEGSLSPAAAAPPVAAAAVPSTVSAAPPPAPSLSRAKTSADPKANALARNDFAAFDRIEMQEAQAKRGR